MRIKVEKAVVEYDSIKDNYQFNFGKDDISFEIENSIAYLPLINSHDHLIGNWYPPIGDNRPYKNTSDWVSDMRNAKPFKERSRFWKQDPNFDLMKKGSFELSTLGGYKNIFSGVGTVMDHMPIQTNEYYNSFPINVINKFDQLHSLSLGNWWGKGQKSKSKTNSDLSIPFAVHVAEGVDDDAKNEFDIAKKNGLLKKNVIFVHGIALTKSQIKEAKEKGTTICWSPTSNMFLIGKTLDIDSCLEIGVNVVIGTDSSFSGSINLFDELKFIRKNFPQISPKEIYKMISINAEKALLLDHQTLDNSDSILITEKLSSDVYDNLTKLKSENIILFVNNKIPIYGRTKYLQNFDIDKTLYTFFEKDGIDYFVIGNPMKIMSEIEQVLGYPKRLPYLPFIK